MLKTNVRKFQNDRQSGGPSGLSPRGPEEYYGRDFRFWHKADMATLLNDVRFWGQSGHVARWVVADEL
jgi:hypothetical protein